MRLLHLGRVKAPAFMRVVQYKGKQIRLSAKLLRYLYLVAHAYYAGKKGEMIRA